ncbi:hypothetical protein [Anabaena subtropica]|uniref:ABC transporter permease n=1 Tax=Anabaena subtropica FACHB-260 TaxID=2692884 RepID=A0ABR8CIL0_9NOST|nr:hypothetical protein [Anabaena subtropica]MBD2343042.1 hypothetical protein [Anabaena subtropica FACHB-260]
MALRNNSGNNFWQNVRQDSVSWGSLALWVTGLVAFLLILTTFANA